MLAWVSATRVVRACSVFLARDLDFGGRDCEFEGEGDSGSTCTISSQAWTMDRMRDDLPRPA